MNVDYNVAPPALLLQAYSACQCCAHHRSLPLHLEIGRLVAVTHDAQGPALSELVGEEGQEGGSTVPEFQCSIIRVCRTNSDSYV